jgi:hypothetical protein
MSIMIYDPDVWGPHYWFVLFTVALTYPISPDDTTKKKYYNFIQNLPVFIPDEVSSKTFSEMLNKYPVSPYLDSRESMISWVHFIHNRLNVMLGKKQLTLEQAMYEYNLQYELPKYSYMRDRNIYNIVFILIILLAIFISVKLYI